MLRDYDGQVAEAMVRVLNKMTKVGMPESPVDYRDVRPESYLFNKVLLFFYFIFIRNVSSHSCARQVIHIAAFALAHSNDSNN